MSVSAVALAGVIALGGLGSPLDTAKRIAKFDNAGGSSQSDDRKSAKQQYEEKVTICHRPPGNPSNAQTLTLPRPAAEEHLRRHPLDTLGPCPPRRVTICHRTSRNDPGTTLTLTESEANAHLRNHRYDRRGACSSQR